MEDMESVLKKLNMDLHLEHFKREKISPDIVGKLTRNDFKSLGITSSNDMMRLRVECISFGKDRGELKFQISKNMLETLLESGFSVNDMAKLLSVSERTLYRRMIQYKLQVRSFTDMDDHTLDMHLHEAIAEFPRCGEIMLRQILKTKGLKVKRLPYGFCLATCKAQRQIERARLRERLRVIDSPGIVERSRRRLHRRVYNVPAPNHVWHIDTNHKLIRWRFIVAGGVDGFSRFVVFIKCIDNNKAITVYNCFIQAVQKYGLPMKVRTDQGLENIDVAKCMLENGRTIITGKSTHNQRVERMWRDIYEGVLGFFYDLFYFMEEEGILDPLNELHIFALHFVFLPNINLKLDVWNNAWANHRLRTVRSSPLRLFLAGAINTDANTQGLDITIPSDESVVAENDIHELQQENARPVFEQPTFTVSSECRRELEQHCITEMLGSISGIDIFQKAVDIIQRHNN